MYSKLAWRNMRRSLSDYGIYFLTLVFAVAVFYVFNSLADQPAVLALRESTRRMAEGAIRMLQVLTVIMTGLVALLVFYANRVNVKKRSRELGTHLLLGMEQGRLASLLLVEVTIIGAAALAVGLVGGIFLSQLFALVVNRVFAAGLQQLPFVFSTAAAVRTVVCYGVAFVLVGLWQAAYIYRQQLVDLLVGARKNEEMRLRSRPLSAVAALLGALAVGYAYGLADKVSRDVNVSPTNPEFLQGIVLGIVGTYLLFIGLAGLLAAVRPRRGWFARGLNVFLYRQLTSKINTHAGMLATIALMLTVTICAMSFALALGRGQREQAERDAPFDYFFYRIPQDGRLATDIDFADVLALFDEHDITERTTVPFVTVIGIEGRELMLPDDVASFERTGAGGLITDGWPQIISHSAYASLRAMRGYAPVDLPGDGFLIHASAADIAELRHARAAYARWLASGPTLTVGERTLRPAAAHALTESLGEQLVGLTPLLIVPDEVAARLSPYFAYLAVNVAGPVPEAFDTAIDTISMRTNADGDHTVAQIRADYISRALGLEGILLFFASYVGIMFILISATLLALQQVTDALEHRQRFDVLRKLGVDEGAIDGVIARQLGLYFLTPVSVALLHSLAAMLALSRLFRLGAGVTTVWPATVATLGFFVVVYGTYFGLSLQSCRALFKRPQSL